MGENNSKPIMVGIEGSELKEIKSFDEIPEFESKAVDNQLFEMCNLTYSFECRCNAVKYFKRQEKKKKKALKLLNKLSKMLPENYEIKIVGENDKIVFGKGE